MQPQSKEHQNNNRLFFLLFYAQKIAGVQGVEGHHVETMKNEKQGSGIRSKPHETELTTAAVCLQPRKGRLPGSHSCCVMRY